MKKKFGQNFLKNQDIIQSIINFSNIGNDSLVCEIGPGAGALTEEIVKKNPKKFIAVEIDIELKEKLDAFFNNENHKLFIADALKFDETLHFKKDAILIGNLPYNISLKLLSKWIFQYLNINWFSEMILMFQKEVGERILSTCNSKKYGRITILAASVFEVRKLLDINKKNFYPEPKVDSVVLQFKPLKKMHFDTKSIKKLEYISKIFFSNRRKKLKKKINLIFNQNLIEKYNLSKFYELRVENIDIDTFFYLAKLIKD